MRRGVVALGLVPIIAFVATGVAVAAYGSYVMAIAVLAGGLYTMFGSLYGLAMLTAGGVEHQRAAKMLRDHDARRQLPAARVVVRD